MPPAGAAPMGQLSPEMAQLLSQKIREMEGAATQASDRSQKAQKDIAGKAAKTKIKEAKKLVADDAVSASDKVKQLWERLQAEHAKATGLHAKAGDRLMELGGVEMDRAQSQAELNKTLGVKSKLESLCRQLQGQSDTLVEERKRFTDTERRRRHELADEYQHTIEDVKKKMDQQANERSRLARENEELRASFKKFFERYDGREKELLDQQKGRESEVVALNAKLEEHSLVYKQEATREAVAQREQDELVNAEDVLRDQLQTYSNKFNNFQDSLSKSDKVLSQYKRQKNKMQRRVDLLEKENQELQARSDKKLVTIMKDRDKVLKEKELLHAKTKTLQAERLQAQQEGQAS